MMTDAEARQSNEAHAVEIEELRRRGLWQPKAGPKCKHLQFFCLECSREYRRRYWTQEEIDRYS